MTPTDWIAAALVPALLVAMAGLILMSRLPRALKLLVLAGLALRVVGAVTRYLVLTQYYHGVGDAIGYFDVGLGYARSFRHWDFSQVLDPLIWREGTWTGTQFMYLPSGLVLAVIGPTLVGEFVVFSLFAFVGLLGFARAFRRAFPTVPLSRYARWIWLFPSLWFWPSSVGKEAVIMLGIGLAVLGYIGRRGRINWFAIGSGTVLVYAVRPQFAAVLVLCFIVGHWLSFGGKWTPARMVQGVLILALGLGAIWYSLRTIGAGGFDVEGVQSYIETEPARRVGGGSAIDAVPLSPLGAPQALFNVLFRPFPWEVDNPMVAFSCLEMLFFWGLVIHQRRRLAISLRQWRSNRLLRVSIPFVLAYSLSIGFLITNLGIIARQRVFLFPFLFAILEAMPQLPKELAQQESKEGDVATLLDPAPAST
ncbi:MAG TPA: hypothetical protein VFK13_07890 [Gemmatimonadaceae bacterium]|nr:hypothetical protein [Gemmatimonadaceae bacterium]